jgi:hypothetical protein
MVYEYTLMIVLLYFFLFVDQKSKLADNTCFGGPQFYSCLSNLIWILKIIETNELFYFLIFL